MRRTRINAEMSALFHLWRCVAYRKRLRQEKKSKKQEQATVEQVLTVASKLDDSLQCFFCLAIGSAEIEVKLCSGCGVAKYCSKSCQKKAWADHSVICKAIQQLSVPKQTSLECDKLFPTNLNPHQRNNIAKLVGNMCLINCTFDGKLIQALFDTGAQVSIISSKTLKELLPKKEIKDISCLLRS